MFQLLKLFNEKIGFPLRYNYLTKCLAPFLKDSKTVLDIGSACGSLTYNISQILPNTEFIGVDINVPSKTYIPVKKYDGKKLPFPDNSFDCVMMIDVLHHDKHPKIILKEAKRVSRKYILIKDHYWKNKLDFLLLKYGDYIGNIPYGTKLPYSFLKIKDWQNLIKTLNLKIIKSKKFRYNIVDPSKHVIFLLKKQVLANNRNVFK